MVYATLAEGRDEDQLEVLDAAIGMMDNPQDEALRQLREHQEAMGLRFDEPDAPVAAPDDGTPGWMRTDEEFR